MSHCPKHLTFNEHCRDCLRRKYEEDDLPDDAISSSGADLLTEAVIADAVIDAATTTDSPSTDTPFSDSSGEFGGAGAGGDF
jgi:hypothetical protein